MKILFIYPETPVTFWSFKNAVKFIARKSSEIPLGLLTVAAMLPDEWEKKLIDTNITRLKDSDILWADYIFISAMSIHRNSFKKIVRRCNELGKPVVAGGPMVSTNMEEFLGVDHFVLYEAEEIIPKFIQDLENGTPEKVYRSPEFPDITRTPVPKWELLEMDKYAMMSVQYSRGCPYDCEFCSITVLNGRRPRTKTKEQFLTELESLYKMGWRGSVFIVDDNFIGNRRKLKQEILPAMIEWGRMRNFPFSYTTEVSINLADDEELVNLMVAAGFDHTFIGIESVNDDSLKECGKSHNRKRDLVSTIKKLQQKGLMVSGGFILGFDHDHPGIFEQMRDFIQNSGIVTAMVGLLNAPNGTKLFKRLSKENRIIEAISGDNMDGSLNFIPRMDYSRLIRGYKELLESIYSPREYYERVKTFLKEYKLPKIGSGRISLRELYAFFKSIWIIGIFSKGKRYYWKLILHTLAHYPRKFQLAITMSIYGFHFRKVVESV